VIYRYKPEVLAELAGYGVFPKPHTRPELVIEFMRDLYRTELRRLRDQLLRGEIRKPDYYGRVVAMRRKYPVVSLKPHQLVAD
jgi:hypothetical protein